VRAAHDLSRVTRTFNESNLVPNAGLLPAAVLAQRIDLAGLIDDRLHLAQHGANCGTKALTVIGAMQVERGWRDMKGALGLRPAFHYREDRIRSHVQLCWLALLLLRVVENATDDTWRNIRHELDRLHLVTLSAPNGQVAQRSALTTGQKSILTALKLPEPPRFFDFPAASD
jgi:hypothetical protein